MKKYDFRIIASMFILIGYIFFSPILSESKSSQFYEFATTVIINSSDLEISQKEVEISKSLSQKSRTKYLPQLAGKLAGSANSDEYEESSNSFGDFSASVSLSQELINLQKIYEIQSADQRVKAAQAGVIKVRQDVLHEFGLAWAAYWKAIQQVKVGKENVIILDKYRENSQIRYDAGELTITDVRLAETRYQSARSQMSRFSKEMHRTHQSLKEIIKGDVPTDVSLFKMEMEEAISHRNGEILSNHPSVKPLIEERSALDLDIKQQKAGHLPSLSFVSSYEYQFDGEYNSSRYPHRDAKAGIEASIPIYSGGYVTQSTRETIQKKQRQNHRIDKTQDEIIRDINSSEFDLKQSFEEIKIVQLQFDYAKETLAGMNEEYEMGTRSSTDVFLVQADMINSKLAIVQAEEQHARALINYLFSIGKLSLPVLETFSE